MKKNLGSILLLLLAPLLLYAESPLASYTLNTSKTDLYEREAVEITFNAKQKDHDEEMFFYLEPKESDAYSIELLNKSITKLGYHDSTTTFTYLLFAKKTGTLSVGFNFTIKTATDDAVAQIYVGSRDNVKLIETTDTVIKLDPLKLNVKALESDTLLVGDFKLTMNTLNSTIDQFGTVNTSYMLNGVGYVDKQMKLLKTLAGATLFDETVDHAFKATKNGYVLEREYVYAMSADESFEIPAVVLKAYSPRTGRYYTLQTPRTSITVEKIDPMTLLDDKEFPIQKAYDLSWIKNTLIALLIFAAGFMTAKLSEGMRFKWLERSERFKDIKESRDAKGLLNTLLTQYSDEKVERYVDVLEMIIYKRSKQSFKDVKRELLRHLHNEG